MNLKEIFEESPIIAAVNSVEDIHKCFESDCKVVFIIHSSLKTVKEMVELIKQNDRIAIVHADLVAGLGSKDVAVEFLYDYVKADGIISTKPVLIKKAKELGMIAILRAFMIDSSAIESTKKQMETLKPDAVELMPGIVPRVFAQIRAFSDMPIIAGGLIQEKGEVITAFNVGVNAVSATNQKIWFM